MERTSVNIRKPTLGKLNQVRRELAQRQDADLTIDETLWLLLRHWDATKNAKVAK